MCNIGYITYSIYKLYNACGMRRLPLLLDFGLGLGLGLSPLDLNLT
jgi:hypothetical protein